VDEHRRLSGHITIQSHVRRETEQKSLGLPLTAAGFSAACKLQNQYRHVLLDEMNKLILDARWTKDASWRIRRPKSHT
jgi:hypothetical protein